MRVGEERVYVTKGELLLDESCAFLSAVGNCWGRDWSKEERIDSWFKCVSEKTGGAGVEVRSVVMTVEGTPHSLEREEEEEGCVNLTMSLIVWG